MQNPFFLFPYSSLFFFLFFFSMSPTYSMQNISYSHIFLSLVAGDDISEVLFNVASNISHRDEYLFKYILCLNIGWRGAGKCYS